jgi:SPP1 gp7 family putative phage head morphogenesis protein
VGARLPFPRTLAHTDAETVGTKVPRGRIPKINFQPAIRNYARDLKPITDLLAHLLDTHLIPALPILFQEAEQQFGQGRLVTDGAVESLTEIIDQIRADFATQFDAGDYELISRENGRESNALNKDQTQRQLHAIGIDVFQETPALEPIMAGWVTVNTQLIGSIEPDALRQIQREVTEGMLQGQRHEDVAKRIAEIEGITETRARLIARDQIGTLNSQLSRTRQVENGVRKFVWRTSDDERVRESHEAVDDRTFTWKTGAPIGFPGGPINCRCTAEPHI